MSDDKVSSIEDIPAIADQMAREALAEMAVLWPCCGHSEGDHGTEGCTAGWLDPEWTGEPCHCFHAWPDQKIACPERDVDRPHCVCWPTARCCGCRTPAGAA